MGQKALAKAGKWYDSLLGIAAKRVGRRGQIEGSDVAASAVVRLGNITDRTAFDRTEDFMPFAACIIKHEHFNLRRKELRELQRNDQYYELAKLTGVDASGDDINELKAAMDSVFEREPESAWFMLMHLEGKSAYWIADVLDVSHTTIYSRISYIKSLIAQKLGTTE